MDRLMFRFFQHPLKHPVGTEQSGAGCSFRCGPDLVFEAFQERVGIDFFRGSPCAPVSTVL